MLLEGSHESSLFFDGLEATVSHFGGGIDKGQFDGFHSGTGSLLEEGLSEGDWTLLGAHNTSLDHDEIVLDQTVVNETTDGVDGFVSDIGGGGSIVAHVLAVNSVVASSNAVDLLVDLRTVVVSLLSGSGHGEGHTRRMPGSDTGDLAETLVSLAGQFLCVPSASDSVVTATLGDTDAIDHFGLGEDSVDGHVLLEVFLAPVDLLGDGATVDLDFHDVCLFLAEGESLHLRVADGTDGNGVLFEHGQVAVDGGLALVGLPALGGLGESLLLGRIPAAVESALDFIGKMGGPDGLDRSGSVGGLDVSGDSDDLERGGLDDGDGFDHLLLVDGRTWFLSGTNNVGHTGLETDESSKVDGLGSVILWEGLCFSTWADASLFGQEFKRTVSGCGELTMGHTVWVFWSVVC